MADTFKGIITADGKKRQLPYANLLEAPVSDKTLSKDGGFADAKVTGDNFAKAKAETDSLKGDLSELSNDIGNYHIGINLIEYAIKHGLYIEGKYVASGTEVSNSIFCVTDFLPLSLEKDIYAYWIVNGTEQDAIGCFYDADKSYISNISKASHDYAISNQKYVRLNFLKSELSSLNKETHNVHITKKYLNPNILCTPSSRWKGKTINVIGDSITAGYGLENALKDRYTTLLAEKTGATVKNFGVIGSKVSEIDGDSVPSFVERIGNIDTNADLTIIFGGTNDYWHHLTEIGTIATNNNATFKGALSGILYWCQQYGIPTKQIVLVFPFSQWFNETSCNHDYGYGTLKDFRDAMKDVAETFGIPMLDLYSNSGWNVKNYSAQRDYFTQDGVHPTIEGHKWIADKIFNFIEYQI